MIFLSKANQNLDLAVCGTFLLLILREREKGKGRGHTREKERISLSCSHPDRYCFREVRKEVRGTTFRKDCKRLSISNAKLTP